MIFNTVGRYSTAYQPSGGSEPSFAFTAINQYVAIEFTAEKTMTITQFGMSVNGSSGTPPIRIAMWSYPGGQTWAPSTKIYTDANSIITTAGITTPTFVWWNLTTPQTITRGTTYAIGLESYGTWSGSLSVVQAQQQGKRDYAQISGQPFGYTSSSGATLPYRWGIADGSETYGYPVGQSSSVNIGSFSAEEFGGNSFTIPTSMGATCLLQGVVSPLSGNTAFVTTSLRLYNATSYPPTLIASRTINNGGAPSATMAWYQGSGGSIYVPFTSPPTLTTGVKYLVGFASGGDAFRTGKFTFNRAQDADALSDIPMLGVDANLTTNTWTESGTIRWCINPDITTFTPAAGASGGGPVIGGRLIN